MFNDSLARGLVDRSAQPVAAAPGGPSVVSCWQPPHCPCVRAPSSTPPLGGGHHPYTRPCSPLGPAPHPPPPLTHAPTAAAVQGLLPRNEEEEEGEGSEEKEPMRKLTRAARQVGPCVRVWVLGR